MADKCLTRKTAHELAAMIKSRAVSPVEVLDAHLAVIARVNPKLNAIVTLAAEQAKEHARAVEAAVMRGGRLGALAGLPVAIKDVTPTAGIRTTFGSPLYKDHVPEEDAEAVRRLKAAGAIVLAKTNTPEFATGANTVNAVFGAIPGIPRSAQPAPPEARRWRSRPAWFRSRREPISAARSEFRRRSAAS